MKITEDQAKELFGACMALLALRASTEMTYEDAYRSMFKSAGQECWDWEPAKEYCRDLKEKLGKETAMEVWRDIQKDVKDVLDSRR